MQDLFFSTNNYNVILNIVCDKGGTSTMWHVKKQSIQHKIVKTMKQVFANKHKYLTADQIAIILLKLQATLWVSR